MAHKKKKQNNNKKNRDLRSTIRANLSEHAKKKEAKEKEAKEKRQSIMDKIKNFFFGLKKTLTVSGLALEKSKQKNKTGGDLGDLNIKRSLLNGFALEDVRASEKLKSQFELVKSALIDCNEKIISAMKVTIGSNQKYDEEKFNLVNKTTFRYAVESTKKLGKELDALKSLLTLIYERLHDSFIVKRVLGPIRTEMPPIEEQSLTTIVQYYNKYFTGKMSYSGLRDEIQMFKKIYGPFNILYGKTTDEEDHAKTVEKLNELSSDPNCMTKKNKDELIEFLTSYQEDIDNDQDYIQWCISIHAKNSDQIRREKPKRVRKGKRLLETKDYKNEALKKMIQKLNEYAKNVIYAKTSDIPKNNLDMLFKKLKECARLYREINELLYALNAKKNEL